MRSFFHKEQRDAELESELAVHLELAVEENLRRGLSPEEARRQALIRFGGVEQAKEQHREVRGLIKLDIVLQDLKYTFRTLGRDRGFTIVAILILALGIGANIAVFSVVDTLLLRPLPFANAQRLVWIAPPPSKCGLSCATYSTDAYDEFRAYSRSYQDVTGYFAFSSAGNLSLNTGGAPIPATSIDVIANFFQVLGVQPAMAAPSHQTTPATAHRPSSSSPTVGGNASSPLIPPSLENRSTSMASKPPSSASCQRASVSTQSFRPAPRSTPSRPSTSTALPAIGATSSPSLDASSPASRLLRQPAMRPRQLHTCAGTTKCRNRAAATTRRMAARSPLHSRTT
jgi:hypothetical protein